MSDVPVPSVEQITAQVGHGQSMPSTDSVDSLERRDRRSAKKIAEFLWDQYQKGKSLRVEHVKAWKKVSLIMSGTHWFTRTFQTMPLPRKGEVRAVVPIMKPLYRWEMGRLNANTIGVTATPKIGAGPDAFYRANAAQASMETWIREAKIRQFFRTSNEHLLVSGKVGYHWFIDDFARQVKAKAIPGHELFPIPYNARCVDDLSGIMRAHHVSDAWLEQQDEIYERKHGRKPPVSMAKAAKDTDRLDFVPTRQRSHEGAVVLETWMKPNQFNNGGEYMFMVSDRMFMYVSGTDEQGRSKALAPNGRLPWAFVDYEKDPEDFWGFGFCEALISPQLEANRQMSELIMSARHNKGWTFYDEHVVKFDNLSDESSPLIPMRDVPYETGTRPPVFHFPPTSVGRDVGAVLELVSGFARQAVGYESGIIFGQQEGRTEGGPATNILNSNAQAPLQTPLDNIFDALTEMYEDVLDMLKIAWPQQKKVRQSGTANFIREMVVTRDRFPTSDDVQLRPTPLLANGRNAMVNLLFSLRQMPAEDGTIGGELKSREFRRALRALDMNPPGIEIIDKAEERILWRIGLIVNDGQTPGAGPPGLDAQGVLRFGEQVLEEHRMAIELLKEAILDPAYQMYSPQVRKALLDEIEYHRQRIHGANTRPDQFDDDIEQLDALQSESFLDAAEQDPETSEGQFTIDGMVLS